MAVALVAALITAVAAPFLGYLIATRKLSGKIDTSEAGQLWAEAGAIRDDYREQISEANKRQVALEARVANLEAENHTLARDNAALRDKVRDDEALIAALKKRVDEQERTIAGLRRQVAELESKHGTEAL